MSMPKLQYVKLISGDCKIDMQDSFVSSRIIKDQVEKYFKLVTVEETATEQRYKIIRFARLYGAPFVYPSASVRFLINKKENTVRCEFSWPDWYLLLFSIFGFGITLYHSLGAGEDFKDAIADGGEFAIVSCLFIGVAVFFDIQYVARRIRKSLTNINEI